MAKIRPQEVLTGIELEPVLAAWITIFGRTVANQKMRSTWDIFDTRYSKLEPLDTRAIYINFWGSSTYPKDVMGIVHLTYRDFSGVSRGCMINKSYIEFRPKK